MFKRIDHIELVTADPRRSIDFYTGVLGFRVRSTDRVPRSSLGVPMQLTYLELGGTTVELIHYEGAAVEPQAQGERLGYRMMALEVDDMQQTLADLKKKGIEAVWGPITRERYSRAEIRDPDGVHIELRQWL